jgi:hypothetical protein
MTVGMFGKVHPKSAPLRCPITCLLPTGKARNEKGLVEVIADVLAAAGKPLGISEVLDGVLRSGYKSSAANFRSLLNMTLVKERKFKNVARGTYELVGGATATGHEASPGKQGKRQTVRRRQVSG